MSSIVLIGHAYGRRATLEISGDTLTWRAQRGEPAFAENIVTTIHDVRRAQWAVRRWSRGGLALAALGGMWAASESPLVGAPAIAVGVGQALWRLTHPRHYLLLDLGDRELVMHVAGTSAEEGRALARRITRTLESGDPPPPPLALP